MGRPNNFECRERYDYQRLLLEFPALRCWLCNRNMAHGVRPIWWSAPWLLHRAHIVNKPRAEDRRAVVLLCPVCHGLHHHERYPGLIKALGFEPPWPTTAELLGVKAAMDRAFYDRAWLQAHCVGKLPIQRRPRELFARIGLAC